MINNKTDLSLQKLGANVAFFSSDTPWEIPIMKNNTIPN